MDETEPADGPGLDADTDSDAGPATAPPRRVLLIEDEPNIAAALGFILGRDGWRVSTHSDGATALDAVARHAPDVIVLDAMLPGRSGFDILGEIRAGGAPGVDAAVPVLMLTAKGQGKDRARAEALGVSRFMTKPFSNAGLLAAVRELGGAGPGDAGVDGAGPGDG